MGASGKEKTSDFLKQGGILAASGILVRIIGMLYRIPMANIIGSEGNGVYSAAFEIYNILLIISSYGMPMAVSKMVSARCVRREYKSAYRLFRYSMVFSIISGGVAAVALYIGADWVEATFYRNTPGVAIPLRVLAPTIFLVAVMGTLRGLYQGRNTMMPTALSQIFEQIVNAIVSVVAAMLLMEAHRSSEKAAAWGAAGGTLGTCIGAATAFVMLFLIYLLYRPIMRKQERRDRFSAKESPGACYKLIFATVIPIILSQTVYQLSGLIDVTLINNIAKTDENSSGVTALLGTYSACYRTLVSVPIAVATSMASSMLPGLVASVTKRDRGEVHHKIRMAIHFNMIIAFPSAMGLSVLAVPIIQLIYPRYDYVLGGTMLMTGSVCVIFYALSTVTSGVLQSIDKMNLPVIHSLVSLIVHIVLVYCLLKYTSLGIMSLVVGNVTYPLLVCILNGRSVKKYLRFRPNITKLYCIPLLAAFVMGILTWAVYQGVFLLTKRIYIAIIPAVIVAVMSYFALVLKLKGLSRQELYEFPMGRRMAMIADKFHLLGE